MKSTTKTCHQDMNQMMRLTFQSTLKKRCRAMLTVSVEKCRIVARSKTKQLELETKWKLKGLVE